MISSVCLALIWILYLHLIEQLSIILKANIRISITAIWTIIIVFLLELVLADERTILAFTERKLTQFLHRLSLLRWLILLLTLIRLLLELFISLLLRWKLIDRLLLLHGLPLAIDGLLGDLGRRWLYYISYSRTNLCSL